MAPESAGSGGADDVERAHADCPPLLTRSPAVGADAAESREKRLILAVRSRRITVRSMTGAPHRPFIDGSRGPQLGGLAAVACRDCVWAQAVNEDLHEGYEDRLMAWHAAPPGPGLRPPHGP